MRLLLHSCCAPCSIAVVSSLRNEHIDFDLFWFNPNIQPKEEYDKRFDCLINFANNENLNLIRFNSVSFGAKISCELCYRTRLEETAKIAKQNGYEAFTTTLLISPYQDHEAIKQIGEELADQYGVIFLYRDFRPLFREGLRQAREKGFYMQKYCGCGKEMRNEELGIRSYNENIDKFHNNTINSSLLTPHSSLHRLELLIGKDNLQKLKQAKVIIFGVGGVGSWCAEALVRSGIGKLDIVDFDTVCESNINRQLQATSKTIGMSKVEVLKQRLLEINPDCEVTAHNSLFSKETASSFDFTNADYVIDAIDMLQNKLDLIETVCNAEIKLFSSMGMALKMDPSRIKTASIWKTDVCPLARLVRQGLRKRGFNGDFITVYSDEELNIAHGLARINTNFGKRINGSLVTVTASAGLLLASLVIQDVLNNTHT